MKCDEEDLSLQLVTLNEDEREIYLFGEINPVSACQIIMSLRQLDAESNKPILLIMNSVGGILHDAAAIYDAICLTKSRVLCQVFGACMSAASFILQACDTRLLAPTCRFMIHNPYSEIPGDNDVRELKDQLKEASFVTDLYYQKLAEKSVLSLDKIRKLCENTTYMTPEEAVANGFADDILGQIKKRKAKKTK